MLDVKKLPVTDPFKVAVIQGMWLLIQIVATRPEGMRADHRRALDASLDNMVATAKAADAAAALHQKTKTAA